MLYIVKYQRQSPGWHQGRWHHIKITHIPKISWLRKLFVYLPAQKEQRISHWLLHFPYCAVPALTQLFLASLFSWLCLTHQESGPQSWYHTKIVTNWSNLELDRKKCLFLYWNLEDENQKYFFFSVIFTFSQDKCEHVVLAETHSVNTFRVWAGAQKASLY